MLRPIMCLLSVTCALEPVAALAAPPTPCNATLESAIVEGLATRLAETDDRGTWAEIVDGAAPLTADPSLSPADRACAAYVAGSAAFFLSDRRADRRRRAAEAVRHFTLAEALAPAAMAERQPRSRAENAWKRLGEVPGWLTAAAPVAVEVALPTGAVAARFEPADPAAWRAVCPEPSCVEAAALRVPGSATVSMRPGRYAVAVEGGCGEGRGEVVVAAGPLALPAPAGCTAAVRGVDGAAAVDGLVVTGPDGATHDPAAVPVAASPLRVSAPGYAEARVDLPPDGGAVTVPLARCKVDLTIKTIPEGATVEGAGPGPWGPRIVSARAPGHGLVELAVEVPRPARCADVRHGTVLVLPRPVTVVATDSEGAAVTLARLVVQGEPVDPLGFFMAPGEHAWQARHPELGLVLGRFTVPPCPAGDCPPARLEVRYGKRATPASGGGSGRGPAVTMALGGALTSAGLIAGAAAWGTHRRIEDYDTKVTEGEGIDSLIETRDTQALAADTLFVAGGLTLAVGLVWWLLEDD